MQDPNTHTVIVHTVTRNAVGEKTDWLAVEEPLEIHVYSKGNKHVLCMTMRTPGFVTDSEFDEDIELAVGFMFTEGLIHERADVCTAKRLSENAVLIELAPNVSINFNSQKRNFYMTSACGVCGKSSLDALCVTPRELVQSGEPNVDFDLIASLPGALRMAQKNFDKTGSLHAAALFDTQGTLLTLREDVGRHNAVDKLLGARFLAKALPAHKTLLVVSGRASFELVQKARMASIPIFIAIGAPSSLAVDVAKEAGMTLGGFARDGRINFYSGIERVGLSSKTSLC